MADDTQPAASQAAPRKAWIDNARDVLARESQVQIDARPLQERLSLAAASYGFWMQHIGNPSFAEGDWDRLTALTRALPPEKQAALTDDLGLQLKALRSLSVADEYFRMEDRVFERAYALFLQEPGNRETLESWSRVARGHFLVAETGLVREDAFEKTGLMSAAARERLDEAGVTHERVLGLMNGACRAMNAAWGEEMRRQGLTDAPRPMRVENAAEAERAIEFNVRTDEAGDRYYKAGARNALFLDPRGALHVAFHEPHHHVQGRIAALVKAGTALPGYMRDADRVFRLREEFNASNCPPDVLAVNETAKKLAYDCYAASRGEETALYQGNRASLAVNRDFLPDIPPRIENMRRQSPKIDAGLPAETRRWLAAKTRPPSL